MQPEMVAILEKHAEEKSLTKKEQRQLDAWLDKLIDQRFAKLMQNMKASTYRRMAGISAETLSKHYRHLNLIQSPNSRTVNVQELLQALHQHVSAAAMKTGGKSTNRFANGEAGSVKEQREEVELEIARRKLEKADHELAVTRKRYVSREELQDRSGWFCAKLKHLKTGIRKKFGPVAEQMLLDCLGEIQEELAESLQTE